MSPIAKAGASGPGTNELGPGQNLEPGTSLIEFNAYQHEITLVMQADGNLVESTNYGPLWSTGTSGHPGAFAAMQTDGNLVIYAPGLIPIWSSGTAGNAGAALYLQADDNVVLYGAPGQPIWASGIRIAGAYAELEADSYWYDCETGGCILEPVQYVVDATSMIYNIPGGVYLIADDFLDSWFINGYTNPIEPYVQYVGIGNYENGQAVYFVGDPPEGPTCSVFPYNPAVPGNWNQATCIATGYNQSGYHYTPPYEVLNEVDIQSLFGATYAGGNSDPAYTYSGT